MDERMRRSRGHLGRLTKPWPRLGAKCEPGAQGCKWLSFKGIGGFLWWSCRRLTSAPCPHTMRSSERSHKAGCAIFLPARTPADLEGPTMCVRLDCSSWLYSLKLRTGIESTAARPLGLWFGAIRVGRVVFTPDLRSSVLNISSTHRHIRIHSRRFEGFVFSDV